MMIRKKLNADRAATFARQLEPNETYYQSAIDVDLRVYVEGSYFFVGFKRLDPIETIKFSVPRDDINLAAKIELEYVRFIERSWEHGKRPVIQA